MVSNFCLNCLLHNIYSYVEYMLIISRFSCCTFACFLLICIRASFQKLKIVSLCIYILHIHNIPAKLLHKHIERIKYRNQCDLHCAHTRSVTAFLSHSHSRHIGNAKASSSSITTARANVTLDANG